MNKTWKNKNCPPFSNWREWPTCFQLRVWRPKKHLSFLHTSSLNNCLGDEIICFLQMHKLHEVCTRKPPWPIQWLCIGKDLVHKASQVKHSEHRRRQSPKSQYWSSFVVSKFLFGGYFAVFSFHSVLNISLCMLLYRCCQGNRIGLSSNTVMSFTSCFITSLFASLGLSRKIEA